MTSAAHQETAVPPDPRATDDGDRQVEDGEVGQVAAEPDDRAARPSADPASGPDETDGAVDEVLPPRKLGLVAAIGALVILFDQLTKHWALNALQDGPIEVIGSLQFNLRFNPGAAFSLGSGGRFGPWIALLALVVVSTLALGYPARFKLGAVAAGLIAGGALGNLIDRGFRGDNGFLHGEVVDFIDLQWWPVFNIADAAICIGAVLLVLVSLREP